MEVEKPAENQDTTPKAVAKSTNDNLPAAEDKTGDDELKKKPESEGKEAKKAEENDQMLSEDIGKLLEETKVPDLPSADILKASAKPKKSTLRRPASVKHKFYNLLERSAACKTYTFPGSQCICGHESFFYQ